MFYFEEGLRPFRWPQKKTKITNNNFENDICQTWSLELIFLRKLILKSKFNPTQDTYRKRFLPVKDLEIQICLDLLVIRQYY